MEYRKLGSTDCLISRLGFGCAPASGYDYGPVDESSWIDAVQAALDCGVNFFDVAEVYGFGHVEELLSRALGEKRHDVVIATKCGLVWDEHLQVRRDCSPRRVIQALDDSLRRLRVDVIPLYQIHWPDPDTPIEETLDALALCQKHGKIRHIGVSNFPMELLRQASEISRIDSLQFAYNLLAREVETDILPWCGATNTSGLAHSGLARGLLTGKRPMGSRFEGRDTRNRSPYFSEEGRAQKEHLLDTLRQLGQRNGRSVSSVALRWVLENPQVSAVLVGIKTREQLEDNLGAVGWQLESTDRELLTRISTLCPGGQAGVPAHLPAFR